MLLKLISFNKIVTSLLYLFAIMNQPFHSLALINF